MAGPTFKLLPCVFCTLGYNSYVAAYKTLVAISPKPKTEQPEPNVSSELRATKTSIPKLN